MKLSAICSRLYRPAILLTATVMAVSVARAEPALTLVDDGQSQAEIVVADAPTRMQQLAAEELQLWVERMSGAQLPIVTAAESGDGVRVLVGQSAVTDALGLTTDGLVNGAYRMVSGDNWLALMGDDTDFEPQEPWARSPTQARDPEYLAAWDALTGSTWGNPVGDPMRRNYSSKLDLWAFDHRGSLNAVYDFLRRLGVEWYMPGELGAIVPERETIRVDSVNETVEPDFAVRYHHGTAFGHNQEESILWYLRMGLNNDSELTGLVLAAFSHGMHYVHSRDEMKQQHPEYYAFRGGERRPESNHVDLTSEGLFDEHVRYVRFMFDHYDLPMVSIFPADGAVYSEDPQSAAQATPERGWQGSHSDYVWGYLDRVAREVYKTHPDRLVSAFAYANYVLPPENIDTLSPNLVVGLLQYRHPDPESPRRQQDYELREQWREKLGNDLPFLIWTHYPFNAPGRGFYGLPVYFPQRIAAELKSLQGQSYGELVEVMFDPETFAGLYAPAFNHLNSYVTARMYWNADTDINALLAEYYSRFYGPAAEAMQAYIEYCEANWEELRKDPAMIRESQRLLAAALSAAPADSDYAQRIELVQAYTRPLEGLVEQLERGRVDVPEASIHQRDGSEVVFDGRLDEAAWQKLRGRFGLVDVATGEQPQQRTGVRMFWGGDGLYIGIRCLDSDMENLVSSGNRHDDRTIWDSDNVEVMIETGEHSWYQITVNPDGIVVDLDRAGGIQPDWDSAVEVATARDDEGWTIEMKIPVAPPAHVDPLQMVIGEKPTPQYPWYFNICRFRLRDGEAELTAWSPTGKRSFQDISRFGELYVGIKPERLQAAREAATKAAREKADKAASETE